MQTRWRRARGGAQTALRGYRQASLLAIALVSMLLYLMGLADVDAQQLPPPANDTPQQLAAPAEAEEAGPEQPAPPLADDPLLTVAEPDAQRSLQEATSTIRGLVNGTLSVLPKVIVALVLLLLAWGLSVVIRYLLHRMLHGWEKGEAISAMVRLALFLVAIGAGLSVIAGDVTALVGSVGLVGLALSWALQTPIESFTGWVLNAFRGYYRPGDRIEVGDVFGDVYRIGMLNTTVWEAGGPGKAVSGSQPTGALITFPNWEILRSNIINYSQDFPYVWDEVTFAVANESDLRYTMRVLRDAAEEVLGDRMQQPATQYQRLLERQRLSLSVALRPEVYLSLADSWTNFTLRYLVPLRERRKWSSELILRLSEELARPEHQGRIVSGYPRTVVDLKRQTEVEAPTANEP